MEGYDKGCSIHFRCYSHWEDIQIKISYAICIVERRREMNNAMWGIQMFFLVQARDEQFLINNKFKSYIAWKS